MSDQIEVPDEPIGPFAWVILAFLAVVQVGVIVMPIASAITGSE